MKLFNVLTFFLTFPLIRSEYRCISHFGLETDYKDFMCSWVHPVDYYIQKEAELGFNCIRLPFSYQYIQEGNLEKMDHFINVAEYYNMSIILDLHRIENSWQGPTPFYTGLTTKNITDMWLQVLFRYTNKPNVIGQNIFNEFQLKDMDFLINYSVDIINVIEDYFDNRYIHFVTGSNWSGFLGGIDAIEKKVKCNNCTDRIMYSAHVYPFSGCGCRDDWQKSFGDIGIPPEKLIIGEMGWLPHQREWAYKIIAYLKEKHIEHTCWWAQSTSGDTIDLWADDCETINWDDFNILKTLWSKNRYLRG
jgi:endoglucanase